jgi:hypothetical protein
MTKIESVQAHIVCSIDEGTGGASANPSEHVKNVTDRRNFADQIVDAGKICHTQRNV